ncbi:MAG: hypothetical protein WCR51_01805 [Planctomycetia bacterium]
MSAQAVPELGRRPDEAYSWAPHQGAELDLLLFKNGRQIGIECKRTDAPALTPSMRIALADQIEVVPLVALVGTR